MSDDEIAREFVRRLSHRRHARGLSSRGRRHLMNCSIVETAGRASHFVKSTRSDTPSSFKCCVCALILPPKASSIVNKSTFRSKVLARLATIFNQVFSALRAEAL